MLRYFYFFFSLLVYTSGGAQTLPEGFVLEEIATGLNPTKMTIAPDGRLFMAEKNGDIMVIENDVMQVEPFLSLEVEDFNERGLSGIAFHPEFEINHWFYVYYSVPQGNHNRVSRFTSNGPTALLSSEVVLLDLDPLLGSVHNAGAMGFGSDGKLYITTGDGANSVNGQSLNTLLGKVLRVNDDGSIPADNPFYDTLEGPLRAIYAYGLRNPFSMAFDSVNDQIFVNDVGDASYEEINVLESGKNYGWALIEGVSAGQEEPTDYQDPLFTYPHTDGCAIVGGAFYNPIVPSFPEEYHGKYFYSEHCYGYINYIDPSTGEILGYIAHSIFRPLGMLFDDSGAMYFIERAGEGNGSTSANTSSADGKLWKVMYTGNNLPFIGQQPQSLIAALGDNVSFSINASGTDLVYAWLKNAVEIPGATTDTYSTPTLTLADSGTSYTCRVSNILGEVESEAALLTVLDNVRPVPQIDTPDEASSYSAGEFIYFSGSATDNEDGDLSENQLTWWIDFHHNIHTHPAMPPLVGTETGAFEIPRIGETSTDVWYRLYLKAIDDDGLEQTVYRDIYPQVVSIEINSEPPGLNCLIDGQTVATPHVYESVSGVTRTVVVPASQVSDSTLYLFRSWNTGSFQPVLTFDGPTGGGVYSFSCDSLQLGSGIGLSGSYYTDFDGDFNAVDEPTLIRIDPEIDFDWGFGSPDASISDDFFGVEWNGYIRSLYPGEYTFYLLADNYAELTVNGVNVIENVQGVAGTELLGVLELEADKEYPIRIRLTEQYWGAAIRFSWSHPDMPIERVRTSQLNPDRTLPLDPRLLSGELLIFPNPNEGDFQVSYKNSIEDILLTDIMGRTVLHVKHLEQSSIRIQTDYLQSGVYLLRATTENAVIVKRIRIK